MSVATPEQVAMAHRLAMDVFRRYTPEFQGVAQEAAVAAALAAIIETSEAAARLAEHEADQTGDTAPGRFRNATAIDIATALRNGEHLKETEHGR